MTPSEAPTSPVQLSVNDQDYTVMALPQATLLDVLRDDLGLTGAKAGCSAGQCGACTVAVDGKPLAACIYPAVLATGRRIRTIEGIPHDHALPNVLVECGAVQCGFCTPGIVMTALATLEQRDDVDEHLVREKLAGNLCRCTGYQTIVNAVVTWHHADHSR